MGFKKRKKFFSSNETTTGKLNDAPRFSINERLEHIGAVLKRNLRCFKRSNTQLDDLR